MGAFWAGLLRRCISECVLGKPYWVHQIRAGLYTLLPALGISRLLGLRSLPGGPAMEEVPGTRVVHAARRVVVSISIRFGI
jgi:hypothetical protein